MPSDTPPVQRYAVEGVVPDAPDARSRHARIAARVSESVEATATHLVPVHEGYRRVPIVALEDDLLLYRVDNGRLAAAIAEALTGAETIERLRARESEPATQRLLHHLLLEKARDPRGPIFAELDRRACQTEPLLVTASGIVVNGNRRLAAMRDLRARDPQRFVSFSRPLVAVLPEDVDAVELEFAEASLQMAPETKLSYGWIERRLKLRRQRDELGLPREWIREAYRLEEVETIDRQIGELALAENYLAGFSGARYGAIEDAEALFVGLAGQLERLPSALVPIWRAAGFAMIEARSALDAGAEKHFPFADPVPVSLPVAGMWHYAQSAGLVEPTGPTREDLSEGLRTRLAAQLAPGAAREREGRRLAESLEAVRAIYRERQAPQRMLTRIREARQMMDRLDPSRLSEEQKARLRGDIAAIHAQAAFLLGERPETRFEQRKTTVLKAIERMVRRARS